MKYCVISGANRGLGLSLVAKALEEGWAVCAVSHRQDCPELRSLSAKGRLLVFSASLDDGADVEALARDLADAFPDDRPLDLLVNNAAVLGDTGRKVGDGLDYEDAIRTHSVNVLGPLRLTEAVWPLLLRSKAPCVANISSEAGSIARCARDGWYGYNMSKAALNMAGRILHNQLASHGGRVIQIHPGWVKTWIKGYFDVEATLTADESAAGVWARIEEYRARPLAPQEPPFVDWEGQKWPW